MHTELKTILQAIFDTENSQQPGCQACQERLYAYIDAELDGEETSTRFSKISRHLEECQECSQLYSELKVSLLQQRHNTLVEPPVEASFDFSGLSELSLPESVAQKVEQVSPPQPTWYERSLEQGQAWIERETERWRQVWLSLASLQNSQPTVPALPGLMSSGEPAPSPLGQTLHVNPSDADLEVRLSLSPDPAVPDAGMCKLEVSVHLLDRFGDFSGVQVSLFQEEGIETQTTDTLGKVSFNRLQQNRLPSMSVLVTVPT